MMPFTRLTLDNIMDPTKDRKQWRGVIRDRSLMDAKVKPRILQWQR